MLSKNDILTYLSTHKDEFSKHFGIVKLGLFGSYSRGTEKNESDIDILIELQHDTNDIYRKKQQFKQLLETHFQRKVDIEYREKYLSPLAKEVIKGDLYFMSNDLTDLTLRHTLLKRQPQPTISESSVKNIIDERADDFYLDRKSC